MKNIKTFFIFLIGVFLFCSTLYGQDDILDTFIYTYDDFDGKSIDESLWDVSGPLSVTKVSGGFLQVSSPPTQAWLHLNLPHILSGDFGIMVSFQNFFSDDELGSLNSYDPSISLQASWSDSGTRYEAYVGREYRGVDYGGHFFFAGYYPGPGGHDEPTTSAVGKLFILRRGSTYQMGYNDGTQTVVLSTIEGGWTGEVSFVLMFGTGYTDGTNFNVDVDYVKSDQSLIPPCQNISVEDSFPAPTEFSDGSVHGIAFDGQSLWGACYGCGFIYKLGFDNGDLIVTGGYSAPSANPTGITFAGKNLYAAADDTGIISKIMTKGRNAGDVNESFYAPGEDCVGLTSAKGHIYNSDFVWSETGGAIHKIEMDGVLDTTFFFPEWEGPEGLAFDGDFIWLAEWYQNKIYKLNIDDLTPVCYFDGPSNPGNPIGLTFDDTYLWLADQYSQSFYKIDIGLAP
jgi:hypothetical protein